MYCFSLEKCFSLLISRWWTLLLVYFLLPCTSVFLLGLCVHKWGMWFWLFMSVSCLCVLFSLNILLKCCLCYSSFVLLIFYETEVCIFLLLMFWSSLMELEANSVLVCDLGLLKRLFTPPRQLRHCPVMFVPHFWCFLDIRKISQVNKTLQNVTEESFSSWQKG